MTNGIKISLCCLTTLCHVEEAEEQILDYHNEMEIMHSWRTRNQNESGVD